MYSGRHLIFGHKGFIGSNLYKYLNERGHFVVGAGRGWQKHADFLRSQQFQYVWNLVGKNGGLLYQSQHDIFTDNCKSNQEILDFTVNEIKPQKVISLVASCAYAPSMFSLLEYEFLEGKVHQSVEQHALAKRHLFLLSKYYSNDRTKCICVCPPTVFGEADKFNENSKLVGAITYKLYHGVTQFLGTGEECRQLLYVQDLMRILPEVAELYNNVDSVLNIPSPHIVKVRDLITQLQSFLSLSGPITFSGTHKGVSQKTLASDEFHKILPNFEFTPLDDSLKNTVNWFLEKNDVENRTCS